eukprot:UN10897
MSSGYISEYNYLGDKWRVVTSAVTGVTGGIKHRHYSGAFLDLAKVIVGAQGLIQGLRTFMARLAIPPIATAAAIVSLILYNMRDVLNGQFKRLKQQHDFKKALKNEFRYDESIYSVEKQLTSNNNNTADDYISKMNTAGSDFILNSWIFKPENVGFYSTQNLHSQMFWLGIKNKDNAQRNDTQRLTQEYQERRRVKQQRQYQEQEKRARQQEKARQQQEAMWNAARQKFEEAQRATSNTFGSAYQHAQQEYNEANRQYQNYYTTT